MTVSDEILYSYASAARDLWLSTTPQKEQVPEHHFSMRFERRMKKLLREQRRSPQANRVIRRTRQAVAVLLIAFVVTFSAAMTVDAFRERVIKVVVQVFHELTDYRFTSHEATNTLFSVAEIGYVPHGMIKTHEEFMDGHAYALYENDDGEFFELTKEQVLSGDSYQMILDTELSEYKEFDLHGNPAYNNEKNGNSTILWYDESCVYTLFSNLSLEELKEVDSSIK